MAIQQMEEDHRQRFVTTELNEAELMDNHFMINHHSMKRKYFKSKGLERSQKPVQD